MKLNQTLPILTATLAMVAPTLTTSPAPQRPPLEFQVESRYNFEATVAAIIAEAPAHKFTVLKVHKMSETLAERGFPRKEPVTIIEVCNAKAASTALNLDIRAGLMMPCPVMVYQKEGRTFVMTNDTRILSDFYTGGAPMAQTGKDVYSALTKILNAVKK